MNGSLVTTHKGAYSAFSCEIGTALKPGADNEIIVKADNASRPDVIPINHVLFGVLWRDVPSGLVDRDRAL